LFWPEFVRSAYAGGGVSAAGEATARRLKRFAETKLGRSRGVTAVAATEPSHAYADWAAVTRGDREPLVPVREDAANGPLHIAFLIPPFGYGSGGHEIVFRAIERLERSGNTCSLWLHDPFDEESAPAAVLKRRILDDFGASIEAPIHTDLGQWFGADIAVATGWQTVWTLMRLPQCSSRAYMVNDDEPTFYPLSIEQKISDATYDEDLYCIAGTQWMFDVLAERHGIRGGHFDYPIAPVYSQRDVVRRDDTIVVYGRGVTPRRAVPLALLALDELLVERGREDVRVVIFGNEHPEPARFEYESAGPMKPEALAKLYSEATLGVAFSMTNASLVPQDMAACGLPCVELETGAAERTWGRDGPVEIAPFDVQGVADAIERLLDDPELRDRRRQAGLEMAKWRTWEHAAGQIEEHLRAALLSR
jgi:glycosyltransferase involved in cell wall biosynthesis